MKSVRRIVVACAAVGGIVFAPLAAANASSDYSGYGDGSIVPKGATIGAGTKVTITWNKPATQQYPLCDDSGPAEGPTALGARIISSMNDLGSAGGWTQIATYNYSFTNPDDTIVSGTYTVPSDWSEGGYIQAACLPTGTSGEPDYNGQLLLALPPGTSTVAAGAGNVTTNGTLSSMTVAVDKAGTSLVYEATDFNLSLAADCGTSLCKIIKDDSGKNIVDATAGGAVSIGGEGFDPGTPVDVYVYSTPSYLGRVNVDKSGNFTGNLTLPATLTSGRHTLQLIGTAKGSTQVADLGLVVRGSGKNIVTVGSSSVTTLLFAVMFIGTGVAATVVSRRRIV